MQTRILDEIGFSHAEKKVYLALLDLGLSTASPILEKTGLQNSVFYRTIHRLKEKGFMTFIKKGKIRYYKAADPDVLLEFLKEKEKKLRLLLPELRLKQQIGLEKQEAEVYSGFKGVKAMLYVLLEGAKKGERFYFFGHKAEIYKELQERFFLVYDQYRKEKGVKTYGIHHNSVKKVMMKGRYPYNRYVSFPIPQPMGIFKDKLALIAWSKNIENPIGILITSQEMADQYKAFFKEMWKIAKP